MGLEMVDEGKEERFLPSHVICSAGVKTLLSFSKNPAF